MITLWVFREAVLAGQTEMFPEKIFITLARSRQRDNSSAMLRDSLLALLTGDGKPFKLLIPSTKPVPEAAAAGETVVAVGAAPEAAGEGAAAGGEEQTQGDGVLDSAGGDDGEDDDAAAAATATVAAVAGGSEQGTPTARAEQEAGAAVAGDVLCSSKGQSSSSNNSCSRLEADRAHLTTWLVQVNENLHNLFFYLLDNRKDHFPVLAGLGHCLFNSILPSLKERFPSTLVHCS